MKEKHEEYLYSPYRMTGIQERVFTTKSDETLTVDPETGMYYAFRKLSKDKKMLHDELVYTKLFVDSLSQLLSLSPSALKLLVYAMCKVRPLSQVVIITQEDVCSTCDFSASTFSNSLYELLRSKIISKKLGSNIEYWFDPNVFFNGNRLRIKKNDNNSANNLIGESEYE